MTLMCISCFKKLDNNIILQQQNVLMYLLGLAVNNPNYFNSKSAFNNTIKEDTVMLLNQTLITSVVNPSRKDTLDTAYEVMKAA